MSVAAELIECAAARRARDLPRCSAAAQRALRIDAECHKAWVYRCWALFELRDYTEAEHECLRAVACQTWSMRDREGMAALRSSCRLLSGLGLGSGGPGAALRSGWYEARLRQLAADGLLEAYPEVRKRAGEAVQCGGDREECSLLDCARASGGLRDVVLGGDGGERNLPAGVLSDAFPVEQATGGVVFLKGQILPFHCDQRLGSRAPGDDRRRCYTGQGPCWRCVSDGFPLPTHRFPVWAPTPTLGGGGASCRVERPHEQLDVLYSKDCVSAELHGRLRARMDELAEVQAYSPMPKYRNIIDPNVGAKDGLWIPCEFEVSEVATPSLEVLLAVELGCRSATGRRLPFSLARLIALAAGPPTRRAACALRTPIPGVDPHERHKAHLAVQQLLEAAAPLLARLRRPALLLPGPLQAVVKAQRIVLEEGEEYAGVWHEDGLREHVVAVVLYYYRADGGLRGGDLEFCSKQRGAMWTGDGGGPAFNEEGAAAFARSLPRCKVPVEQGTMVVFSNYASVHRVLPLVGSGSRDFVALFVIDQRHPLPVPDELPPLEDRQESAVEMLAEQLQPRGEFGLDGSQVYSTGNGSVADVGWISGGSREDTSGLEDASPGGAALIRRLNLSPPSLGRGSSALLSLPPPGNVSYRQGSAWVEHCICEAAGARRFYIDPARLAYEASPPHDGVGAVRVFADFEAWAAHVLEEGLWTDDDDLRAQVDGTALALTVGGQTYHVTRSTMLGSGRLAGVKDSVCLDGVVDAAAWPKVLAFLRGEELDAWLLRRGRAATRSARAAFRAELQGLAEAAEALQIPTLSSVVQAVLRTMPPQD